uniref:phosphotransferase family protein n=1 Tax=Euzebya sp. TaxID=1971409 RepID=UPI0035182FCA
RRAAADPAGLPPPRRAHVAPHAGVLAGLLPDREPTIRRIAEVARSAAGGPEGVVHGDLYEGQVLVDQRGALSLIDLDGAGTGPVLDDCATVVAHLWALAQWRPAAATRITRWADAYVAAATGIVDPHALRHRAAGVLLGLAAGGFAVGETTWHDTAVERLAAAARLAGIADEEVLMATSPRSHARPAR